MSPRTICYIGLFYLVQSRSLFHAERLCALYLVEVFQKLEVRPPALLVKPSVLHFLTFFLVSPWLLSFVMSFFLLFLFLLCVDFEVVDGYLDLFKWNIAKLESSKSVDVDAAPDSTFVHPESY